MIQRFALLIGGLGAAAVLAFALGLTNFVFAGPSASGSRVADQSQPDAQRQVAAAGTSSGAQSNGQKSVQGAHTKTKTKTVVDKVYIAPTTAPKVVHVTKTVPSNNQPTKPAAQPAAPPVIAATNTSAGDDSYPEHESERSGNDERERGDD
jgi:hypothetical protein